MATHRTRSLAHMCMMMLAAGLLFVGCEDLPPNSYVPQYVAQGYLLVDEPIRDIQLTLSQPVTDTFRVANGIVPDADVKLIAEGRTLTLQYHAGEDGRGSYYYPDSTEVVKPGTLYELQITTKDGKQLTAQTRTPQRFAWVKTTRDTVTIPPKSSPFYLKPPDSLSLSWTGTAGVQEYLISVRSLDTLNYGMYLTPPTQQKNRRIDPDLDEQDEAHYNDPARWGFLASTKSPIVWVAFKWFGPQEVTVYAADRSMVNWFKMTQWTGNATYDPLLGNVRGDGIGVFGSASVIRSNTFVLMTNR